MKAIILKQNLMEAINVVQKAIMPKATMPILEGIYIDAQEDMKIIGNCYDLGIEYKVEADILQKGSVVINSKIFGEIIRKLPDAPVCIEVSDDYKVRIECLNAYFEIKGLDGESYPLPPMQEKESSINIKESSLRDMIKQTIFAVGSDENRKIMTGALLEAGNGEIHLVALDGFRMALTKLIVKEESQFKVVIPGKNMNEILRILETTNESVTISLSGSLVSFIMKNCRIVSKIIDGEFMNYRSYIPTAFETVIEIKTKELMESLERSSLITSDDKRYPVRFIIGENNLILSSTAEVGLSKEEVGIKNEGNTMQVGFNPRYFIDALKVINDETIKISFTSSVGPCIITPVDNQNYTYLVLPVRIKSA